MSDPIQIPRAVAVELREALRDHLANVDDDCGEVDCDECNAARPLREAVRVLGNALREPEKERAGTGTPARGVAEPEKSASQRGAAYREHITDGSPCWCNPELDYRDPDTGAEVWIHRRDQ